jgi:type I restriction enzyme, S subunit
MIKGLKPYPAMRYSSVEWLGEVPEHWEVRRVKHVCSLRSGEAITAESIEPNGQYPVYGGNGLRGFTSAFTHEGEFPLVGRQGALCGNVHLATGRFWASEHAIVASPRRACNSKWLAYALRTMNLRQHSLAAAQPGLAVERILTLPIALPRLPEQAAIVRFLDYADRRIRRYIRAKQKLIKLREEQKQASIHRAVTRGLDPNVRLKDSGVEWLGEVPEHWEIVPNRAVMRLKKRLVGARSSEYTLLSLTKRGVIPRDLENPEGKFPTTFDTYQEVASGELIFCLFDIDETPRAVGLSRSQGMVTGAYTRFVCDPSVADWVYHFYLAMDSGKRLKPLYTGLRKVITKSSFLSAKMPLPPENERSELLAALKEDVDLAQQGIERASRQIELFREYRTRLMADVVTGKLDVREAAARLPDETDDEPPVLDDASTEVDLEAAEHQFDEDLEEVPV